MDTSRGGAVIGTTVTTNLALIKPDTSESIKENLPTFAGWADQNADNCDNIDRLFRAATGTYTLNWTASSVNPTLGAGGTTEGKYVRLWPRLVIVWFRIFMGGAGFAAGTGHFRINLPFTMDAALAAYSTETLSIGKAIYQDASAVLTSSVFLVNYLNSASVCIFRPSAGGLWDNASPVVPAQNDRISGYLMYPTSDA